MATFADRIASWLHEKEISHAFGIVGGGNLEIWDAITRLGETEIVCVHHEQAAAMASGYFNRIKGRIGSVCLVTTGGGSTNAFTGVMAAQMDRVPLLVISGNEALRYFTDETRVRGVQGYDSALVALPFTKFSVQLRDVELDMLEHAHRQAMQAPQGAVWLDVPKDCQSALV